MLLLAFVIPLPAWSGVAESDSAVARACLDAKSIVVKAPSKDCGELKPGFGAISSSKEKSLEACASLPKLLTSLDEKKKSSLAKCDSKSDRKIMDEATAAAGRGMKPDSPEVKAGQKAKDNIHRCADLIKAARDGESGKKASYVKARNDMIALREENSRRHTEGNEKVAKTPKKNPACVPESIEYAKANEKLHEIVSALYAAAAARIEASEQEERSYREAAVTK